MHLTDLSMEMHITTLLERKRPKILKKEQTRQRMSPPRHLTVADQMISIGIMQKVTCMGKVN